MAWIPLHQSRARHPKTLLLASLLGKDRRYACGLLDDLWSWALDAANKDGTIPGANKKTIAAALDFSGKEGDRVVNALLESGYLEMCDDGSVCVHDWQEYGGKMVTQKETRDNGNRERQARYKEKHARVTETESNAQNGTQSNADNARGNALVTRYSGVTEALSNASNNAQKTPSNAARLDKIREDKKTNNDDDDGARACEAKSADPFDPSTQSTEEAAARRIALEFLPCGLVPPNEHVLDEIDGMVSTPDYGATPDMRADLVIKAMKSIGEAPREKQSWGNVKGLLRYWQKGGGKDKPKNAMNLREQQNDDTPLTENPYTKYLAEQGVNANASG